MEVFFILLSSMAGAYSTYYLVHRKHFSTIRASSLMTVIFVLFISLVYSRDSSLFQAAFFGATFVGMTSHARMSYFGLSLASILFAGLFVLVLPALKGIGGGLGASAFVSCAMVYLAIERLRFNRQ